MRHSAIANAEAEWRIFSSFAILSIITLLSCKSAAQGFLSHARRRWSNAVPQPVIDATERFRQRITDISRNVRFYPFVFWLLHA